MKQVYSQRLVSRHSIKPPVERLYGVGNASLLEERVLVAIVGSREPTDYGRRVTEWIAGYLARRNAVVVSGLARGIDAVAHYKALELGGKTIGVSAVAPDSIYPVRNSELYRRMWNKGLVVSEHSDLKRPDCYHFPLRNRILAAISDGVIVVEAGERSGALISARYAAEMGIPVFAVPGSIFSPRSRGCNLLIEEGAHPFYDLGQLDLLYRLDALRTERNLSEAAQAVLELLRYRRLASFAEILSSCRHPLSHVVGGIEELIQDGLMIAVSSDLYQLIV